MGIQFYGRRHYRLFTMPDETPERIAERAKMKSVHETAYAETLAKFGAITTENAFAAFEFQRERVHVHLSQPALTGESSQKP